ncbi:MAG: hypothetical protein V3U02_00310 [Calditrichia bacterium]
MRFSKKVKIFMVLAMVAVLGIAVTSFAGWGRGNGGYGMMGSGYGMMGSGYGMMGPGYGPQRGGNNGSGYYGNSGNEEMARFNKEHEAFYEETRLLEEKLLQKELELRSELAKPEPDGKKAGGIQKEITDLEGQLSQKRSDHELHMRSALSQGYGQRGMSGQGAGCGF